MVDSFSDDNTLEIAKLFPSVRCFKGRLIRIGIMGIRAKEPELRPNGCSRSTLIKLFPRSDRGVKDLKLTHQRLVIEQTSSIASTARNSIAESTQRYRCSIDVKQVLHPEGHTQRVAPGRSGRNLHSPIFHDDRKSLKVWFNAQARYTELEAQKLRSAHRADLNFPDRLRRWRIVMPPAMFVYCLIIRGGIFDGRAGFYYAFQRAMAELMLSHRLHG